MASIREYENLVLQKGKVVTVKPITRNKKKWFS